MKTNPTNDLVDFSLLVGVFLLRLGISLAVLFQFTEVWLPGLYQISTFLLICLLILRERHRLKEAHIDGLALILLILFRTVLRFSFDQSKYRLWVDLGFWLISIGLLVNLLRTKQGSLWTISKEGWMYFFGGLGVGICFGWAIFSLDRMNFQTNASNMITSPLLFGASIMLNLSNAAIDEEPFFRGLLWGYLRRHRWKEIHILLFQTALFWIVHIEYYRRPSFWLFLPLGGLLFGLIAWRSRSIAASMATHAGYNAWQVFISWFSMR